MSLRLFDYWRSSASYRVRIALALKGVAYESIAVNLLPGHEEQLRPRYLARNPQGRVPALDTDQGVVGQSLAIIAWLDEIYPEPRLLPADPWTRAKVRSFAFSIACDIHPLNNTGTQRELKTRFGADAQALTTWGQHWIRGGLATLEAMLAREPVHSYAFGDQPGLADICLIPQLANARRIDVNPDDYPRLAAVDRVARAHPAFIAAAPENHPHAPKG
jgi:maleylacetoacetate isomerase